MQDSTSGVTLHKPVSTYDLNFEGQTPLEKCGAKKEGFGERSMDDG
jgi:hypothetical protein